MREREGGGKSGGKYTHLCGTARIKGCPCRMLQSRLASISSSISGLRGASAGGEEEEEEEERGGDGGGEGEADDVKRL